MIDFKIAPSLLASDFSDLQNEIKKIKSATHLHLDVMDGIFVPNISFGSGLIKALRPHSNLIFDTHLMIEQPVKYIKEFAEAGSDMITVHTEATKHLHRVIQKINKTSCQAGVALNPATPLNEIEYVLPDLDLVLIMSVNPGYGGQKFIDTVYKKIERLAKIKENRNLKVKIAVDGGINLDNIKQVVTAGANIIIAGSAIFKAPDPAQAILDFKDKVKTK
jgi:ribulose-phosphate 3-epimerase